MFVAADQTDSLIEQGSAIKVGGAPGAFEKEFNFMEEKLEEVRKILAGTNVTEADLDGLRDKLNSIRSVGCIAEVKEDVSV